MENDTKPAKRPRVDLIPHHHDGPPELWIGTHKYKFDRVTALYHAKVLWDWLYSDLHRNEGPSHAMTGDD